MNANIETGATQLSCSKQPAASLSSH